MPKPSTRLGLAVCLAVCMNLAAHAAPPQPLSTQSSRGELLYTLHCDTCHAEQAHWRTKRQADTPRPPASGSATLGG